MDISVVIPVYDEEANVAVLYEELKKVLARLNRKYEIIFVDDGSTDGTFDKLLKLKSKDSNVKILKFRRNFGQTAALDAGFKSAKGDIIISMDADLQNDPADIPKLLDRMKEGFDAVSGWRYKRKDPLSKKLFSKAANIFRKMVTGETIHDSGCTLKAYKKECFNDLNLFGEMHRYIPALLMWKGFKIGEVKVNHRPRTHGKTKYRMSRIFRGALDLLVVVFWQRYSTRPIHLFGGLGILSMLAGIISGAYLTIMKFAYGASIANRPLLLLTILLILLGVQFIVFGFLADILIKVYYKDSRNYSIEKII